MPLKPLQETQKSTSNGAEKRIEDALDGEQEAIDDLIKGPNEAAQGNDQRRQVDENTP